MRLLCYMGMIVARIVAQAQPITPLAVTNLDETQYNNVKLAWDASANADFYKLYWGTNDSTGYGASNYRVSTITTNSITNLVVGGTYRFVVTAVNSMGESTNSNEVTFTVPAPIYDHIITLNILWAMTVNGIYQTYTGPMTFTNPPNTQMYFKMGITDQAVQR